MSWLVITRSDSDVTLLLIFPTRGSVHLPTPAGMWAGRLTASTDVEEVSVAQSRMWANRGDGGLYIVILVLIWCVTLKLLAFELSNSLFFTGS